MQIDQSDLNAATQELKVATEHFAAARVKSFDDDGNMIADMGMANLVAMDGNEKLQKVWLAVLDLIEAFGGSVSVG